MIEWKHQSIPQIKAAIQQQQLQTADWHILQTDSRKGVRYLVQQHQKQLRRQQQLQQDFKRRCQFEESFWQQQKLVAGIDEVGRGPLAGPVVTAAVILKPQQVILGINDSKVLSAAQRRRLYQKIVHQAIAVSVAVGSVQLIDQENIYHATELTMAQAVKHLWLSPQHLLVDAMTIPLDIPQTKLIKGDARSVSIGAASIVAKVYRDALMSTYAQIYPQYRFDQNFGYGTSQHLTALKEFGPCPLHRKSFAPIKDYYQ